LLTQRLAQHIATAMSRPLPPEIALKGRQHLLDTVAAMVSGSHLAAGRRALSYCAANRGTGGASVIGSSLVTGTVQAALANGMLAHADETDDSHAPSLTHPGCAVVPAALAVAETRGMSGEALLRAVVAGYDVGPRVSMALGGEKFFVQHHSSHAVGGLFGAAAAAGALFELNQDQCCSLLGYAVQMASGNACWRRDPDHIEKAFDFGGMPAMNGTLAAEMVASGFTGVRDALEGNPGLFSAFPQDAEPALAIKDLDEVFEISRTAIKKWCVGSPIQAALDALQILMKEHRLTPEDIAEIVVALPETSSRVVDDRDMPDVNLQHQLAVLLLDGSMTFATSHDKGRMRDSAVVAVKGRISLDPRTDEEFQTYTRQAQVTVRTVDGREHVSKVRHVRGTPHNPMDTDEIVAKARDLMEPILSKDRTEKVIASIMAVETLPDVRALTALLRVAES